MLKDTALEGSGDPCRRGEIICRQRVVQKGILPPAGDPVFQRCPARLPEIPVLEGGGVDPEAHLGIADGLELGKHQPPFSLLAGGDLKMSPTHHRLNGSPLGAEEVGKTLFLAGFAASHGTDGCWQLF